MFEVHVLVLFFFPVLQRDFVRQSDFAPHVAAADKKHLKIQI